jgi:hypothetical protein
MYRRKTGPTCILLVLISMADTLLEYLQFVVSFKKQDMALVPSSGKAWKGIEMC